MKENNREKVEQIIKNFCLEFIKLPYLCYTEHGLHARFFCLLYDSLKEEQRYIQCGKHKVCVVQKEYPTANALGKSRRQNWDIALIESPALSLRGKTPQYDYLTLNSVVEFGLNATKEHLEGDIKRLSHAESNVENKFAVHLLRISTSGKQKISSRDISPNSKKIFNPECVKKLIRKYGKKDVVVYFGQFDGVNETQIGIWRIDKDGKTPIQKKTENQKIGVKS